jgi:hypothetical protein
VLSEKGRPIAGWTLLRTGKSALHLQPRSFLVLVAGNEGFGSTLAQTKSHEPPRYLGNYARWLAFRAASCSPIM